MDRGAKTCARWGNTYSRTKYVTTFGEGLLTSYVGGEAFSVLKTAAKARFMSGVFRIGVKTIEAVSTHLEQFGYRAENTIMLDRMEKIAKKTMKATEIDINFAKHELREIELQKGYMKKGMTQVEAQEAAHTATLKEQGMYHRDYQSKLYTKEAIEAGDAQSMKEATSKH